MHILGKKHRKDLGRRVICSLVNVSLKVFLVLIFFYNHPFFYISKRERILL
jgi:hypothetical protein